MRNFFKFITKITNKKISKKQREYESFSFSQMTKNGQKKTEIRTHICRMFI